ncbi:hypothetical protein ONR57_09295 [Hoyosella sp. YIM 151337]|uniref:hypothetical protein n=1 Tax=Hoyosella sp. YIM 151337 TaxID=2992742 RepID=UPI0022357209|nr:hypothetical protein [Hoyosella sp. YIM 151337]MCW4353489.1 hypothetical protein [Hoyosella sp. YIM 151337]
MPSSAMKRVAAAASIAAATGLAVAAGPATGNAAVIDGYATTSVDGYTITITFHNVHGYTTDGDQVTLSNNIACGTFVNPTSGSAFSLGTTNIDFATMSGATSFTGQPGITYYFTAACTDGDGNLSIPVDPNPVALAAEAEYEDNYHDDYQDAENHDDYVNDDAGHGKKKRHGWGQWTNDREDSKGTSYARSVLDRIFG